jgi:hypothetical protein
MKRVLAWAVFAAFGLPCIGSLASGIVLVWQQNGALTALAIFPGMPIATVIAIVLIVWAVDTLCAPRPGPGDER